MVGFFQEQLELGAALEPSHVFNDENLRVYSLDHLQVLLPELVSGVVDIAGAQAGEALTGRTTDDDVCRRHFTKEGIVDISPEGVVLAEVCGICSRRVQVPLHRQHGFETVTYEACRQTSAT